MAIRTNRWKYAYYHGQWDIDSLHDLDSDPHERHNLINVPAFKEKAAELRAQLFAEMEKSGGLDLPLRVPAGDPYYDRKLKR